MPSCPEALSVSSDLGMFSVSAAFNEIPGKEFTVSVRLRSGIVYIGLFDKNKVKQIRFVYFLAFLDFSMEELKWSD